MVILKMKESKRENDNRRRKSKLERMIVETKRELNSGIVTYRESVFLNKQLNLARDYYEHLTGEKYVEK